MRVEIWSDIVCPWCYIGRRRFEAALAAFPHADQVEVVWRSYQLDPKAPRTPQGNVYENLAKKLRRSMKEIEAMHQQVTQLAAVEGLDYQFDIAQVVNTFDAHRLIHLAAHHGLQSEMKECLQRAYFTEGQLISDVDTLVRLGAELGLNVDEVRHALTGDVYTKEVWADIQRAMNIGVRGVPFFLFDEKYAVSGAQPADLFLSALERTWADSQSAV